MSKSQKQYLAHGLIFTFPAANICRIQSAETRGAVQTIASEIDGGSREPKEELAILEVSQNVISVKPLAGKYAVLISKKNFKAVFINESEQTVCSLQKASAFNNGSNISVTLDRK